MADRSSSAAGRAATLPRSAPPSWARRPRSSSATKPAGAASTTPASRRRRCSARRRSTTRPSGAELGVVGNDVQTRLGGAAAAPRRRSPPADRRRRRTLEEEQGRVHRGRRLADRRGQRQGRRRGLRGEGGDPGDRLGGAADPRRRVRRPRASTPGAPGRCRCGRNRIAVVGAGASGLELASAYARFGTEVLLIEMLDQILPAEDKDMAKVVERVFKKQGIEISTGAPVENVEAGDSSVKFTYGDKSAEVDYLCIAGGRGPDTEGLGLEEAAVELEEGGRKIKVDEFQRTTNPKVFAIGDLVNKKALAHKASEEGVVAVETAAGVETHPVDQELMVGATFCQPQVASVGLTEAEAERGRPRGQGRQAENRRRGRGHRLRRQRRPRQARRRRQVRRGPRRPCRRQPRLRHDRRAGRDDGARGRLPGAVADRPPAPDGLRGRLDAARAVDGWAIHA